MKTKYNLFQTGLLVGVVLGLDARPLPQERENRSPASSDANGLPRLMRFPSEEENGGECSRDKRTGRAGESPSLAPGERAGVRASFSKNFLRPFSLNLDVWFHSKQRRTRKDCRPRNLGMRAISGF